MKQLDKKKTVFLIDGSSFLYRAYYSLRPLHTPKGEAVQAVYGFCRMIKKLVDTYGPRYLAIIWDPKGGTTRHEMYKEYKATREAPPSDLFDQKDYIVKFADLIGLKQFQQKGIEADDVMYSIAKERAKEGDDVVFVTSDKDMGQAISDQIFMLDTFKEKFYDKAKIKEKMGFPVAKMPFYFALLGDVSDNIPGVRGIGKKTALVLVNQFDSLEVMYKHLDEIAKARIRNALEQNKDNAFLSQKLFLLQYHPTKLSKKDLAFDPKNWMKARPLFEELHFKSLLKDLGETKEQQAKRIQQKINYWKQFDFKIVTTAEGLNELCNKLKKAKAFAVDTETDGLNPLRVRLIGISFCAKEGEAFYVPCAHKDAEKQLSCDEIIAALKPIIEDPSIKKYVHNAKYDQHVLSRFGMELHGLAMDTMVAANLIIKDWQSPSLKKLSQFFFDEEMLTYEDVVTFHTYKNFSYVPLDLAVLYSCTDVNQTIKLVHIVEKELKKQKIDTLYYDIEHPLVNILYNMEKEGIQLDSSVLEALDKKVTLERADIEAKISTLMGKDTIINLNSPQQVEELLFYKLNLPPQKKSVTGHYSTDQEVLTTLSHLHPIPGLILKYRELSKLKSTYIDALPHYIHPETGRIHTTYNQISVVTGRLASSNPNLQNIPADTTGYGLQIRAAFKPKPGNVFISADYSQIELRVLAHLSQDTNLVAAFLKGHDIHRETAARLFDVSLDEVTHDQRQLGKRINFSILYGLTPYGLSKNLGVSFKTAKQYIEKYLAQYPQVSEWMETIIDFAKKHGYVQTLLARRRYVPNIYEQNRVLYEEARRVAINTVAQGTAAEIMKKGMINLVQAFQEKGIDAQILLQIHDELLISVCDSEKDNAEKLAKQVLESVVDWKVPLEVSTRIGCDWKEVTK